jgi:hypothetical protein
MGSESMPMDAMDELTSMKMQLTDHETRLACNEEKVDELLYQQNEDRITTLLESNNRKLRIYKLQWSMKEFKTKDRQKKNEFILMVLRQAFVNPELIRAEDATANSVTSLKPVQWKDNHPLDIEFSSVDLVQHILDGLAGKRLLFPIRQWLPKIIMARYDELLKTRSIIKEAKSTRRVFVDVIPRPLFVILVEKIGDEKKELEVKWDDPRLANPVLNYRSWSHIASKNPGPSKTNSQTAPKKKPKIDRNGPLHHPGNGENGKKTGGN